MVSLRNEGTSTSSTCRAGKQLSGTSCSVDFCFHSPSRDSHGLWLQRRWRRRTGSEACLPSRTPTWSFGPAQHLCEHPGIRRGKFHSPEETKRRIKKGTSKATQMLFHVLIPLRSSEKRTQVSHNSHAVRKVGYTSRHHVPPHTELVKHMSRLLSSSTALGSGPTEKVTEEKKRIQVQTLQILTWTLNFTHSINIMRERRLFLKARL